MNENKLPENYHRQQCSDHGVLRESELMETLNVLSIDIQIQQTATQQRSSG